MAPKLIFCDSAIKYCWDIIPDNLDVLSNIIIKITVFKLSSPDKLENLETYVTSSDFCELSLK